METLRSALHFFEAVGRVSAVVLLVAGVAVTLVLIRLGMVSRRMTPRLSSPSGPLLADGPRPNWVSTTARSADVLHAIAPRPCPANPIAALAEQLARGPYDVHQVTDRYIHATTASPRFGFVDDIEFLYDPQAAVLHARSASRVGYSDFGVNRRRLEQLLADMA